MAGTSLDPLPDSMSPGLSTGYGSSPVILLQGPHEVATAFDVPAVDVGVQAGPQGQLERLTRHRLRRAVHHDVAARELLVEVTLLQVQPDGEVEHKPLYRIQRVITPEETPAS